MLTVITGAGGGMGAETARRFADEGPMLLCDVSEAKLDALVATLPGQGHRVLAGDLADPAVIDRIVTAVAAGGGLRRLVHTAGLSPMMADARRILDVNLCASVRLVDALLPYAGPDSVALLVASIAGHNAGTDRDDDLDDPNATGALDRLASGCDPYAGYSYSKRGVMRLAEARAAAWGRRGARIVSISPGLIDTPMNAFEFDAHPIVAQMLAATPVPRMGTAGEIADAVAYLCSPAASFITGTDLRVDGGIVAVMHTDPGFGQ
ncbi:MAG: family oxidoreductase [Sphingomonadales bacterium]|nr:family oxidoreductase [Sphingomonadales bacterium]